MNFSGGWGDIHLRTVFSSDFSAVSGVAHPQFQLELIGTAEKSIPRDMWVVIQELRHPTSVAASDEVHAVLQFF